MQQTSATQSQTPTATAADLCQHLGLSDGAKALLRPEHQPKQFLNLLIDKKLTADAVQMIAHYLPKRQAVWWACHCALESAGPQPKPEVVKAVQAAERWVAQPTEENRRATQPAAEDADTSSPAGCAALAAFYSEGTPAPDAKAQAKAYYMTAKLVAGSVLLAASVDSAKVNENLAKYVETGVDVVNRTYA